MCFACKAYMTDAEITKHDCSKLQVIRSRKERKWINTDCRTKNLSYHYKLQLGFEMVNPDNN